MGLDEVHQLFLQSCMSRRAFSEKTGQAVYKHCWKVCHGSDAAEDASAPSYGDIVDEINTNIEAFGFHIKRFLDEYSGKPWTAFINTKSDDIAKVATEYTPQEIAYFRTIIKLIMKSGDRYAVPSNEAKQAGKSKTVRPELKLSEAEKVLRSFVARGWLIASSVKLGNKTMEMYQLSSRARMELEHYLAEQYPSQMDKVFECKVCNEIVMKGAQCPTENCITRMHDTCARSYFARNQPKCPGCQSPWDTEDARRIGPEAPENAGAISSSESEIDGDGQAANAGGSGSEAPNAAKRPSKGKGKAEDKGKGKAVAHSSSGAEDNGDAMEEDEEEASGTSRRRSGRQSAVQQDRLGEDSEEEKNVRMTAQEEDEEEEERDELEDDDDDDDLAARRAAKKLKEQERKKRKATSQAGR